MSKYTTLRKLMEDDFFGAEPDLGGEPDVMGDDFGMTPPGEVDVPIETDLPNITLSEIQKAILALVGAMKNSPLAAKQQIDRSVNAVEGIKDLVATGLIIVKNGQYQLDAKGESMLRQYDLTDDAGGITTLGKALVLKYLY